jgi:hypothetical protein
MNWSFHIWGAFKTFFLIKLVVYWCYPLLVVVVLLLSQVVSQLCVPCTVVRRLWPHFPPFFHIKKRSRKSGTTYLHTYVRNYYERKMKRSWFKRPLFSHNRKQAFWSFSLKFISRAENNHRSSLVADSWICGVRWNFWGLSPQMPDAHIKGTQYSHLSIIPPLLLLSYSLLCIANEDMPDLLLLVKASVVPQLPHNRQNWIYKIMHVAQFNKLELVRFYCY